MVDNDGRGRLLGIHLKFLREEHADAIGLEQLKQLHLIFEPWTCRIAEAIAGTLIALAE